MSQYKNTSAFFLNDFPKTLFPLELNRVLVTYASESLGDYIYGKITHNKNSDSTFLTQTKAYASKSGFHLRRTAKLDPIAEFYLYDLVYRNRSRFRKSHRKERENYGYRFESGQPISATLSYQTFKEDVRSAAKEYKYCVKFDVSSYFNSIYHHDLVMWFNTIAETEEDAAFFDKFLKQINAGRSIDCLPHGIYPAKMIGAHFLSFIDNSNRIESSQLLRFMDDFYLFSDSIEAVTGDFLLIQRMLGEKGLSINPVKTKLGDIDHLGLEKKIDDLKLGLLRHRALVVGGSGVDQYDDSDEDENLTEEEIDYLFNLLRSENLEEEDAELVLALMRDKGNDILEFIPIFLQKFPNLSKNIYYFCDRIDDKEAIATLVSEHLLDTKVVTEYQLFWLGKLLETQLLSTNHAAKLLINLFEHQNSTDISRAKILEIPELRFGMADLREEYLRTGASGWLAWASAVGSRKEKKINRNHLLGYFSNGSEMNHIIAQCVSTL